MWDLPFFHTFLISCSLLLQLGCSSRHSQSQICEVTQLVFGRGGGFAGEETNYVLDVEGHLLQVDWIRDDTTKLATLDANTTKHLFERLDALDLTALNIQQPGNLYYFIKQQQADTTVQIVWGNPSYIPPTAVKQFYDTLKKLVPQKLTNS